MTIQLYADDSGLGQDPFSAFGGLVARADTWAKFNGDWQAALDADIPIKYFKLSEATARQGEFKRYPRELISSRIKIFMEIIAKHQLAPVSIWMQMHDYREFKSKFPPKGFSKFTNQYFIMSVQLMSHLVDWLAEHGIEGDIEFIFDEQIGPQKNVIREVEALVNDPSWEFYGRIKQAPKFIADHLEPGLQAADAVIWWLRREFIRRRHGKKMEDIPFITSSDDGTGEFCHGFDVKMTRSVLVKIYNNLHKDIQ